MRRGRWTSDTFSLPLTMRSYATMAPLCLLVLIGVVAGGASAYPGSPYWMNGGRSSFAMPAAPPQFFPNRALSFSGYFTGSGTPYRGQWAATRQESPYYLNEDGSMQVSGMMDNDFGSSHGYNMVESPVSMDGSGLLIPGNGGVASGGAGRVDSAAPPQFPPEVSTTTLYPEPEVSTVAGASEEPTPTPTTATPIAESEPTTTTTVAPQPPPPPPPPPPSSPPPSPPARPSPPVAPAASEPAGASAPPPPPTPPKRRNGGRSNQPPQYQPQDNDNDNYGNPTINAWFPFVFGGSGGGNPNRAFNADDDTHLTPNSYNSRPQYGRSTGTAGHSPVAIANSFSTGRNAMAHSVATAYGAPPPNASSQQRN